MTSNYEETDFSLETRTRSHVADWSFSIDPCDNNHFTVCRDGISKTVKVKTCHDYVYSLQKTQVKAIDGAQGLYKYVDGLLSENFSTWRAWTILHWCFDTCKAAV